MSAVWYVGSSKVKFMGPTEWLQKDIIETETFAWSVDNGWSIPQGDFTSEELSVLDEDSSFLLNKPDGPRTYPPPVADASDPIGSAYAYYRALRDLFESDHVSDKWRGPGLESVEQVSPYSFQLFRESDSGPIPLGDPIVIPAPQDGQDGQDGDDGQDGRSVIDLQAVGASSVQFYVENPTPGGDPIPLGPPVSVSVNWTTVTHGTDMDKPRPPIDESVIWIGEGEADFMQAYDVLVDIGGQPATITTTTMAGLNIGTPYLFQLLADGTGPIIWRKVGGTLPNTITISDDGRATGTPTSGQAGDYTLTVGASNPFGDEVTETFNLTIGGAIAPSIVTDSLGTLQVGAAFAVPISVSGSAPITLSLKPGDTLPSGFVIDPDPAVGVHGTPASLGAYGPFNVRATNSIGYADQPFSGTVIGTAPTITTTSLGSLYRGIPGDVTALAASGAGPITWTKTAGTFPAGIFIDGDGEVTTNSPTTVGSYSFTMQAHNAYGDSATVTFTGNVTESTPVVAESSMGSMPVNVAYSKTITLVTGGPTIEWTHSGTLPTGVTWDDATHSFGGTPTVVSTGSFTVIATNPATGEYDEQVFSWAVTNPGVQFSAEATVAVKATQDTTAQTFNSPDAKAGDTIVAWFQYNANGANPTWTATYNGSATGVTVKGTALYYASLGMYWGIGCVVVDKSVVVAGVKTMTLTPSAASTSRVKSTAWSQVNSVSSAIITTTGSSATPSQAVSSAVGNRVSQAFAAYPASNSGALTSYAATPNAATERYNFSANFSIWLQDFVTGDAAGAATVTFTCAHAGAIGFIGAAIDLGA